MPAEELEVFDVAVVGAGPAGAVCALESARSGLRTVILEKESLPRYKTCGGGLVWRARRRLRIDLGGVIEHQVDRVRLHLHDAAVSFTVSRDYPLVSMAMRSELDRRLIEEACRAGATLQAPCAVQGLEIAPRGVTLQTDRGALSSRFVVGADGGAGATARAAGWSRPHRRIPAVESEIEVEQVTYRRFAGSARFDFGLVPAGYAWVFPKRRHLSVGCLSFEPHRPDLWRHLDRYLELLRIAPLSRADHGFVIPIAPPREGLARGRVLLAGDAAGLVDPVTCEGISHAITSGRLASAALVANAIDPTAVTASYQASLAESILPELRRARLLARCLYGAPRLRRLVFRHLGRPLSEAVAEIISGELTYRQLLASPLRYLRAVGYLARPAHR